MSVKYTHEKLWEIKAINILMGKIINRVILYHLKVWTTEQRLDCFWDFQDKRAR